MILAGINNYILRLGHDKLMLCLSDAVGQQFANCKKKKNHVIDSSELTTRLAKGSTITRTGLDSGMES